MKIKRSSWHYKISNLSNDPERDDDNLCQYFWRLVGRFIGFFTIGALLCLFIYGLYCLTHDLFMTGFWISNTIMLFFICFVFAFPILAIHFLRKMLGKSPEMPYGNIVSAYASARKRKLCPLIKYV